MNMPNKLTFARMLAVPFLIIALLINHVSSNLIHIAIGKYLALLIFILASLTDFFDGVIARREKKITNFGKLMDPIADKLLVTSALIVFIGMGLFPSWMVVIIISREFIITGLRNLAATKGVIISAGLLGKHKTGSQITAIIITLISLCIRDTMIVFNSWENVLWHAKPLDIWMHYLLTWVMAVVVIFSVISGIGYMIEHKDLIREAAHQ
ncbi:CDP-diacylglycerol--glycerol-3-phosphate 3-phosphatidyltransferase [bacterium]|nr:CDP-diacylglycerol--glycerol-3-phosphate 3-phosphatidyltransferase [bacterium]